MIDGVIASLMRDVMPELTSQKAVVALVMAQSLLESVKQRVPIEQQLMASEHNQMTALYRQMARTVDSVSGAAAEPIAARTRRNPRRHSLTYPCIPNFDDLAPPTGTLSQGLVETLEDLDALIRDGSNEAEEALPRCAPTSARGRSPSSPPTSSAPGWPGGGSAYAPQVTSPCRSSGIGLTAKTAYSALLAPMVVRSPCPG